MACGEPYLMQSKDDPARLADNPSPKWDVPQQVRVPLAQQWPGPPPQTFRDVVGQIPLISVALSFC